MNEELKSLLKPLFWIALIESVVVLSLFSIWHSQDIDKLRSDLIAKPQSVYYLRTRIDELQSQIEELMRYQEITRTQLSQLKPN